ncbi:MAG: hypothetical protein HFJ84_02935 [Clostridiales bacterium]|jgi:hypothetical protein|nr:hypothetical protein [Clostridiales bacterium]
MKKKSQPSFCKSLRSKLLPLLLSTLLVCSLCGSSAFAMEGGEAGITPDPPTDIVNPTPDPEPQPDPEPPAESSNTPSSTPSSSSSSESSSSSGESSSANSSSSQPSSGSDWNSKNPSSASSRPSWNGNTSSSKTSYADPDPNESYVEYIPPKNNGNDNNGHTTSAQNPVAIAPDDDTEILSSQNWQELLSVDSKTSSSTESASSSLTPMGGIFGKNNNTGGGGTSIVLILGIVMLVLGAGGVGFFIYSQFIYKRRKGADSAEDYENSYLDYGDEDDGYGGYDEHPYPPNYRAKGDTAPLQFEKTDRDISSFSDPTMKPANPIQPPPAEPPAQSSRRVEDIDWDQFFKDNRKK